MPAKKNNEKKPGGRTVVKAANKTSKHKASPKKAVGGKQLTKRVSADDDTVSSSKTTKTTTTSNKFGGGSGTMKVTTGGAAKSGKTTSSRASGTATKKVVAAKSGKTSATTAASRASGTGIKKVVTDGAAKSKTSATTGVSKAGGSGSKKVSVGNAAKVRKDLAATTKPSKAGCAVGTKKNTSGTKKVSKGILPDNTDIPSVDVRTNTTGRSDTKKNNKDDIRAAKKAKTTLSGKSKIKASQSSTADGDRVINSKKRKRSDITQSGHHPNHSSSRYLTNPDAEWNEMAGIYHSQVNVASDLAVLLEQKQILPTRFNQVRVLFIGPPSVSLQSQTLERLEEAFGKDFIGSLDVVNSSSLPKDYKNVRRNDATDRFLSELTRNKSDFFLVVHDEMHWGITEQADRDRATLINNFFKELTAIADAIEKTTLIRARVGVLLVSATPFSLSFTTEFDTVAWSALMHTKKNYFRPPSYLSWYMNDLVYVAPPHKTAAYNSSAVMREYKDLTGVGKDVIEMINTPEAKSAFLRLQSVQDAEDLYKHWRKRTQNQKFYVINLSGDNARNRPECVQNQVKTQLKSGVKIKIRNDDDVKSFFDNNNCLIICVGRFAMGETLTRRVSMYDVRARYSTSGAGTLDIIIQDLGRVAGHGKKECRVYHSVNGLSIFTEYCKSHGMSSETLKLVEDNPADQRKPFAYTLNATNKAKNNNPQYEFNSKVYSKLHKRTIVLEAEPQLGKTGVIIALLCNLSKRRSEGYDRVLKEVVPANVDLGYQNTNPEVKAEINQLLRQKIVNGLFPMEGLMVFLDHTDFGTATALAGKPVNNSLAARFVIPQYDRACYETMKAHKVFGGKVVQTSLDATFLNATAQKGRISILYADFCGAVNFAERLFTAADGEQLDVAKAFHVGSLIAVTICARSAEPSEYVNEYVEDMFDLLYSKFKDHFTFEKVHRKVYGEHARMLIYIIQLTGKLSKEVSQMND